MLYFIVQRGHDYTLRNFLDSWGRSVRDRIAILNYVDLAHATKLPAGTYVFTDHDRMTPPQVALASAVADTLMKHGCPALSHPRATLGRVAFLGAMHQAGINDFRAILVRAGIPADLKFPVFLRLANEHTGSLGELIHSRGELDRELAACPHRDSPHLLVVEFCDTSRNGLFGKYGAMRIGQRIMPRHVFVSRDWVTKRLSDEVGPEWLDAEDDYLRRFDAEFAQPIRRIFDLAKVDYGRLDFAVKDGSIRAWEINTNTMLVNTPDAIHPDRLKTQSASAKQICDALVELDERYKPSAGTIRLDLDPALRNAAGVTRRDRLLRGCGRVLNRLRNLPGVPAFWAGVARARWLARQ